MSEDLDGGSDLRSGGASAVGAVNSHEDLVKLLDPWTMEVVADFNVRGNIKTVVRAQHNREK